MKGETKRYDSYRGTIIAAKREILGKTYLVVVYPERGGSQTIMVYADTVHGNDLGFPDDMNGGIDWERIVKTERDDEPRSAAVATAVSDAVSTLESHINNSKDTEEQVLGALEANAEVHEE